MKGRHNRVRWFVWEGLQLLQESCGAQPSIYVYEPINHRPLASIDGAGPLEPEHPAVLLALAGDAPRSGPAGFCPKQGWGNDSPSSSS
jgi:hypothetical protein